MSGTGKYRHRFLIEKRATTQDAVSGQASGAWTTHLDCRGEVSEVSTMESLKQQIPIGEITHTVKLHYRPGVLNAMRVSWDGRILGIVGVTADPRKRFLTLNCKEAV